MTRYSLDRPAPSYRSRTGPSLAPLGYGQVAAGQPVTVRTRDTDGRETEFPAVYVRTDGLHFVCAPEDAANRPCRYRPSQIFPRRVAYRRWTVTLERAGDDGPVTVIVTARTALEARCLAVLMIRDARGEQGEERYLLHSVKREG